MKKILLTVPLILLLAGCGTSINQQKVDNQLPPSNQAETQAQISQPERNETEIVQINKAQIQENNAPTKKIGPLDEPRGFVKEKTEGFLTYYKGSAVVSGELIVWGGNGPLCFFPNKETKSLIPRDTEDKRTPWFCFDDETNSGKDPEKNKIAKAFGLNMQEIYKKVEGMNMCPLGKGIIEISDYVVNVKETEVADSARLKKVANLDPYQEIKCDM